MARMKKSKGPLLKTREDVEICMGALAELTIKRMAIEATLNDELKAVRDRYQEELGTLGNDADAEFRMLKEWAEAHPEEFKDRKSMELTHGALGFRTGTPAVKYLKKITEEMAIGLMGAKPEFRAKYVRELVELNKQAIIEDREALKDELACFGLRIAQSETFFVEPKIEPKG